MRCYYLDENQKFEIGKASLEDKNLMNKPNLLIVGAR